MTPALLYLGAEIPPDAIRQRQKILAPAWDVPAKSIEVLCEEIFLGQRGPSFEQLVADKTGLPIDSDELTETVPEFVERYNPRVTARHALTKCIEALHQRGFQVRGIEIPFGGIEEGGDNHDMQLELLRGNTTVPLLIPRILVRGFEDVTLVDEDAIIDRTDPNDTGADWPDPERPIGSFICLKDQSTEDDLFDAAGQPVFSIIGYEERRLI